MAAPRVMVIPPSTYPRGTKITSPPELTAVMSAPAGSAMRALSPRDRQTLDKARKRLICEIAEVTGETKGATAEQVDSALKHENRQPRT